MLKLLACTGGNDLFLNIELIVLNSKVNENGVQISKGRIEQFVDNQEAYVNTPLYCDKDALLKDEVLGHKFDRFRNEFQTEQIGNFTSFSYVDDSGVAYLIGHAAVPKRNQNVIRKLKELNDKGALMFSYEIDAVETELINGVKYITDSPLNLLTGVAVVSSPAVKEARALMVASKQDSADEKEESEKSMDKENKKDELEKDPKETVDTTTKEKDEEEKDKKTTAAKKDVEPEKETDQEEDVDGKKKKDEEEETAACGAGAKKKKEPVKAEKDDVEVQEENIDLAELMEEIKELRKAKEKLREMEEAKIKEEHDEAKAAMIKRASVILTQKEITALENAFENLDECCVNKVIADKAIEAALVIKTKKETETTIETASSFTDSLEVEVGGSKFKHISVQ